MVRVAEDSCADLRCCSVYDCQCDYWLESAILPVNSLRVADIPAAVRVESAALRVLLSL